MRRIAVVPVLLVLLAGCTSQGLTVADVWGRPPPSAATNAAFYLTINNGGEADQLVSADSSACGTAELHEMYDKGDGVMGMRPVEGIEIPAGGSVTLEPGGLHVMCIGRLADFTPGDHVPLTLEFQNAGTIEVNATIRES
ncbi:MAG: copper chaperone PCu(A)C [Acidimicrobiia bacterium]